MFQSFFLFKSDLCMLNFFFKPSLCMLRLQHFFLGTLYASFDFSFSSVDATTLYVMMPSNSFNVECLLFEPAIFLSPSLLPSLYCVFALVVKRSIMDILGADTFFGEDQANQSTLWMCPHHRDIMHQLITHVAVSDQSFVPQLHPIRAAYCLRAVLLCVVQPDVPHNYTILP